MIRSVLAFFLLLAQLASAASAPEIVGLSIARLEKDFAQETASCRAVVQAYLERIGRYDRAGPRINSYIALNPRAGAEAAALDAMPLSARRALFCVPVIVKDNIDVAGLVTTGGSQLLNDNVAVRDAALVARLRNAGAIILGKGNLDEWAHRGAPGGGYSSAGGQTRNPYDPSLSPGGSSGGPAAAVAADLALVGIGTDTSGSLRSPAAQTGLVTIKPTVGLVPTDGLIPFSPTTDVAGPLTRSVADAAAVLDVLAGSKDHRYVASLDHVELRGRRVGVLDSFRGGHAGIDAATEQALERLQGKGVIMVRGLTIDAELLALQADLHFGIIQPEFKTAIATYLADRRVTIKSHADILEQARKPESRMARGLLPFLEQEAKADTNDRQYRALHRSVPAAHREVIDRLLRAHHLDALVFATVTCPAAPYAGSTSAKPECADLPSPSLLANDSGYPQIVVPNGLLASGLPVSFSFLGTAFSETMLLRLARGFELAGPARIAPTLTARHP